MGIGESSIIAVEGHRMIPFSTPSDDLVSRVIVFRYRICWLFFCVMYFRAFVLFLCFFTFIRAASFFWQLASHRFVIY